MSKVRKAIIPAAGLGTRFLPATKSVPKEMLTIVDAPIIFYVVEEAIQAGIEDIVLIQGHNKTAIEDFFDRSYELEDTLEKSGKMHLLERMTKIREMVNLISVRQKQPLGLGHAVLCGQVVIGDDPFAVLLGDEIMIRDKGLNTSETLCKHFAETQKSTVAVMQVEKSEVSKYGIADVSSYREDLFKVKSFVEKPQPNKAPSQWALPGRYIFTSEIFDFLKNGKAGINGEIQLTDSMNMLAKESQVFAATFTAKRYDAGDKLGYLEANVELALKHPDLREGFIQFLTETVEKINGGKL
jgi:UTP--glucose-1-phosphate uridylyltransferase